MTRTIAATYAGLLLAATSAALLSRLGIAVLTFGVPHAALRPCVGTAASLLVHNTFVGLWPLVLVWLGWPELRLVRRVGDGVIAAQILGQALIVGTALGERPDVWRFLPHLPAEWLGLAVPVAGWARSRRGAVSSDDLVVLTAAAIVALAIAAVIETWAVPL